MADSCQLQKRSDLKSKVKSKGLRPFLPEKTARVPLSSANRKQLCHALGQLGKNAVFFYEFGGRTQKIAGRYFSVSGYSFPKKVSVKKAWNQHFLGGNYEKDVYPLKGNFAQEIPEEAQVVLKKLHFNEKTIDSNTIPKELEVMIKLSNSKSKNVMKMKYFIWVPSSKAIYMALEPVGKALSIHVPGKRTRGKKKKDDRSVLQHLTKIEKGLLKRHLYSAVKSLARVGYKYNDWAYRNIALKDGKFTLIDFGEVLPLKKDADVKKVYKKALKALNL